MAWTVTVPLPSYANASTSASATRVDAVPFAKVRLPSLSGASSRMNETPIWPPAFAPETSMSASTYVADELPPDAL